MKCQEYKNEVEGRAALSSEAALHIDSCAECRGNARLKELLNGLDRLEVPGDFNFQLNARIARGKPVVQEGSFFPSLRFAFPVAAIVMIVSIAALSGLFLMNRGSLEQTSQQELAQPGETKHLEDQISNTDLLVNDANRGLIVNESGTAQPAEPAEVIAASGKSRQKRKKSGSDSLQKGLEDKDPGGGSRDLAGTSEPAIIQPEFDTNRKIDRASDPQQTTVTGINEIFKLIGITAKSLKVIAVDKSSLAERSGVKTGDIVEAINGKKITAESITGEQISVQTLTIVRDGSKVEIELINN